MTWFWYTWPSVEAFGLWHESVKTYLNIPFPGRNMATGDVDLSAQWTTAYTQPTVVAEDDVRARVEWFIAEKLPDGMGAPSEAPPSPDVEGDI